MFIVTEEEAAAIQRAFKERGEWAAVVELRRLFPGVRDNADCQKWVRTIVNWQPVEKADPNPPL
ncbi:hypothetical protein [Azospirillum sp. SYSU D00513]|uniref:hypothetical protein n=1 Tax=Azospirillum sp. SYSU D00513 TaxID=2812561 RepID=UPI0020005AF2|nr:hypothetical protein [Azospirillum sp. SYSU D00513]